MTDHLNETTVWAPVGAVTVNPDDGPAFVMETCQRMAMVLPHFLIPLYAKRDAMPPGDDEELSVLHTISTLEMTAVGIGLIERSQERKSPPGRHQLTVLRGGLLHPDDAPLGTA